MDSSKYNLSLLEGASRTDLGELKNKVVIWLGKSLDDIADFSFKLYLKGDLEYPQARFLFSDQMILYTIKLMEFISVRYSELWSNGKYEIIKEYDENCKDAMEFLMKKYPLKEGGSVEPELFKLIPTIDKTEDMTFDMLHLAGITFTRENISKQIKQTLNYFMRLSKSKSTEFRKDMSELFTLKNDKGEEKEIWNLVGMKFSENVEQYSENEVNEKGIKIKGPEVLRVIIKWIEGLESRCKDRDKFYINRYYPFMSTKNR